MIITALIVAVFLLSVSVLVQAVVDADAVRCRTTLSLTCLPSSPTLAFVSQPIKSVPISAVAPKYTKIQTVHTEEFHRVARQCLLLTRYTSRYTSCASLVSNHHSHQHITSQLHGTIDDNNTYMQTIHNTIERLELDQQFERWKFMQRLLEGELSPSDIEDVLLLSLNAYLQHGPTSTTANNKNDNGGNASPVLNDEQISNMEEVINSMLAVSDGIGDSKFLHMLVLPPVDYESTTIDTEDDEGRDKNTVVVDTNALSILEQIEKLLPDPDEDEDAYKSTWDVIIDLYGRESVRVKEEALQREKLEQCVDVSDNDGSGSNSKRYCADSLQWRTLCTVGRVLIHYDFLTEGVLKEGTFGQVSK